MNATALDPRLVALARAAELAEGRLEETAVAAARRTVEKAGRRLGLGVETTVVALAGPTGAGKSSLFNALVRADVAEVSRLRPTTSAPEAAVWGEGGDALLDWLDVRRRHRVDAAELEGLVLLDLPDFDSVELGHRLEVDRLVELVDLVLWVTDPQKYADAVWHERYLRPLAAHAGAMAIVMNQIDLLAPDEARACLADLDALVERELGTSVPLLGASARRGDGVEDVRVLLSERVAARAAAVERLAAHVETAVARLSRECGPTGGRAVAREDRERLIDALADVAGVDTVAAAVAAAHRRRGALAAGWPFVRWVRRVRPDPLRRLRLPERPQETVRTSLPPASGAQLARAETAARRLADGASYGLPEPWPRLLRAAATSTPTDRLADRLDRAVAGAELYVSHPRWWRAAGLLQRLLALAAAGGLLWLLVLGVGAYFRLGDVVPVPAIAGVELPTALALGGLAGGILLALLARTLNGISAGRRRRAAVRSVRARVADAAEELVIQPVEAELAAHDELLARLEAAAPAPGRGRARRRRAAAASGAALR